MLNFKINGIPLLVIMESVEGSILPDSERTKTFGVLL